MREHLDEYPFGLDEYEHTFSTKSDGIISIWDVTRLWKLAASLTSVETEISTLEDLKDSWVFKQEILSPEDRERIENADTSYPVILSGEGNIMDGFHRIANQLLRGKSTVMTVRFDLTPPPDIIRYIEDDT